MKLKFNNEWMSLYVKSMGKLHSVVRFGERPTDRREGLVTVSELNGRSVMAKQYPRKERSSSSIKGVSSTGFYICSDREYFDVKLVTQCQGEANSFMEKDDNAGLIATDNEGFHYVAALKAAQVQAV
ncbi:hypothetical protein [Microbulbifer epialgicus]|uniref:Uncharacterized protein n=1 Tax=Microbulbifer epialgicus TaxID=393907 RepID=A0ABV4NUQ1_9GAMM